MQSRGILNQTHLMVWIVTEHKRSPFETYHDINDILQYPSARCSHKRADEKATFYHSRLPAYHEGDGLVNGRSMMLPGFKSLPWKSGHCVISLSKIFPATCSGQLAFHPSWSMNQLPIRQERRLCQMAGKTVWSHMKSVFS